MATITEKSDAQIKTDVLSELKWDPTVDETEVGVQVKDGVVTLAGNISSYPKKLAGLDAAHRVNGVRDVVDNLTVRIPSTWARSDEDIAKAVRHGLTWDVLVPDERITTTVAGGTVTLEGNVESWSQRYDAERAVQRVTGVRSVINHITVNATSVSADLIRRQIEEALERQTSREAKRINVAVRDGVVTLTGAVRSWTEKNALERAAYYSPGVKRVVDNTTVDSCL
ncbi:MAG: BON domain-containing protein [Phycisphaerae bacterium]|jgi:osmotically-inducible protein OsmY